MNTQAILNILWKLAPLCSRKEIEEATNKIINSHEQEDEKEIALRVINDKFLKGINEDDYPNLNVNDILHWMEGK